MRSVRRILTAWGAFWRGGTVTPKQGLAIAAALLLLLLTVGMKGSCPMMAEELSEEFGAVHWYLAEWEREKGTS